MRTFLYLIQVSAFALCSGVARLPELIHVHPEVDRADSIDISKKSGDYFSSFEIEFNGVPAREFFAVSKALVGRVVDGKEVLWEAKVPGDRCTRVLLFYHLYTPDVLSIHRTESNDFDIKLFRRINDRWTRIEEKEFLNRLDEDKLLEFVLNVVNPSKEFANVVNTYMQGIYAKVMRPLVGFKAVALSDERGVWFQVPQVGFSTVVLLNRYGFRDLIYVCGYGTEYQIYYYFFGEVEKGWEPLSLKQFSKEFEKMAEGRHADQDSALLPSVAMALVAMIGMSLM